MNTEPLTLGRFACAGIGSANFNPRSGNNDVACRPGYPQRYAALPFVADVAIFYAAFAASIVMGIVPRPI